MDGRMNEVIIGFSNVTLCVYLIGKYSTFFQLEAEQEQDHMTSLKYILS